MRTHTDIESGDKRLIDADKPLIQQHGGDVDTTSLLSRCCRDTDKQRIRSLIINVIISRGRLFFSLGLDISFQEINIALM